MRNLILLIYIFSTLASCDRLDGLDEGDRNTYTWKGQLVQDFDGQAASECFANARVKLRRLS